MADRCGGPGGRLVLAALLGALLCRGGAARAAESAPSRPHYLKGQTHLHSASSGDSRTPPSYVARWYAAHGYDFIVFTDHNYVTDLPRKVGSMLVIRGAELTQNAPHCHPPPEPGLMCLLHINALFLGAGPQKISWPARRSAQRLHIYQRALDLTARRGGLAQLNHPNFEYAADSDLITELARRGALLMEIANQSCDVKNEGDARHPSTETQWDAALTAGATIYGVASDDAHHYSERDIARGKAAGEFIHVGDKGFVMVRAQKEPGAIRDAMARGDFYSSTGVRLSDVAVSEQSLDITVADESEGPHRFTFIGRGGQVLSRAQGRQARFPLQLARGGYVRAFIQDERGRRAWVQPVRVP